MASAEASTSSNTSAPLNDPLDLLLQHVSLQDVTYTSEAGEPVADLLASSFIHFPTHASTPLARSTRTRAVRSRSSAVLQSASLSTPTNPDSSADEEDFLPLDALIFLLITQSEAVGLYAVKATRERVARVDTLDRPTLLDFLLGKKSEAECEVVLSKEAIQSRDRRRAEGAVSVTAPTADGAEVSTQTVGADSVADASTSASVAAIPGLHPLLAGGKRPYVPSKQDAAFVKRLRSSEVILRDRTWAFRCTKPTLTSSAEDDLEAVENAPTSSQIHGNGTNGINGRAGGARDVDFTSLRRSVTGRIAAARKGGSAAQPPSSRPGASSAQPSASRPESTLGRSAKHRRQDPIIILPSSPSSLLTLANIKRFLEDGVFVPPSSASNLAPTGGSNEVVLITRPRGGRFLAIDSLDALNRLGARDASSIPGGGNDPWRRVVCVITTGQTWQFKGYKWEDGRDLFKNVFGLYPHLTTTPKVDSVRDWNLMELKVEPEKRHHDRQLCDAVWRNLEAWIARRKPELGA